MIPGYGFTEFYVPSIIRLLSYLSILYYVSSLTMSTASVSKAKALSIDPTAIPRITVDLRNSLATEMCKAPDDPWAWLHQRVAMECER